MFDKDFSQVDWEKVKQGQLIRQSLGSEWIRLTGLAPGMRVMDIGTGPGVFTRMYAEAVGEMGRVYALEKSPQAMAFLRRELQDLKNVEYVLADAEQGFGEVPKVDVVFITDVLHHVDTPGKIFRNISRVVSEGAKVLVAEYDPTAPGEVGPPLEVRIPLGDLQQMAVAAGFQIVETGTRDHEHYYVVLQR
ncbi:class I SAM-dependent methyltransferase [Kyrpidia tusciae]|uniref:Methyltransferase type 12 n=1 Tax=Kyrpidia tusciae (strain DSM 2912 / NBRC 15312 / T2) TaxID=562970 RepID=D5WY54_KYRT2|nr:methyltransferase domain-containing protein [Kyrpidia tusciae]ADG06113.1 Methyltransferase type 12 [Kyrpidia tusciae DSM 2912]